MINIMKTRLGVLRCPVAVVEKPQASVVLGGGTGASWLARYRQPAFPACRTVIQIPPYTTDNSISLSAARERWP